MRFLKTAILVSICLVISECAMAQRPKRSHRHYKSLRVKSGYKSKIDCPVFESSGYPYNGLGFKLGDPFAITYKLYPNKHLSFAVDVGKASSGLYNRYFREKFNMYTSEADTLRDNASLNYSAHQIRTDLIGEFKVLYHIEAYKVSPGLQIYLGAGWEWKSTRLKYGYFYNWTAPNGSSQINEFRSFTRTRVTMGPQVVAGIEYAYFQIPISAFMEVEYFTDMQADPGWRRFEGGVGLRFIF
jgi:hypothetical protein